MPKKFQEKRNYIRAKRVLSVQYRLVKPRRKSITPGWHLSTTEDMSLGGLSFVAECELKEGDTLDIHVVMSGILDIFKGTAKIMRIAKKKSGSYQLIGVKFIKETTKKRSAKTYVITKKAPHRSAAKITKKIPTKKKK